MYGNKCSSVLLKNTYSRCPYIMGLPGADAGGVLTALRLLSLLLMLMISCLTLTKQIEWSRACAGYYSQNSSRMTQWDGARVKQRRCAVE